MIGHMQLAGIVAGLAIGLVAVLVASRRQRQDHGYHTEIAKAFVTWLSNLHKYGHDFTGQGPTDAFVLYADSLREIESMEYFRKAVRNEDAREQLLQMFERHPEGPGRILRTNERRHLLTGR